MYHAQIELTNKLTTLQFQFSHLFDEVYALRNIFMDLNFSKETQIVFDKQQDDKGKREIDINRLALNND